MRDWALDYTQKLPLHKMHFHLLDSWTHAHKVLRTLQNLILIFKYLYKLQNSDVFVATRFVLKPLIDCLCHNYITQTSAADQKAPKDSVLFLTHLTEQNHLYAIAYIIWDTPSICCCSREPIQLLMQLLKKKRESHLGNQKNCLKQWLPNWGQ